MTVTEYLGPHHASVSPDWLLHCATPAGRLLRKSDLSCSYNDDYDCDSTIQLRRSTVFMDTMPEPELSSICGVLQ